MTVFLENYLSQRERQSNLRQLIVREGLIDLASNDYLGLARSQILAGAVFREMEKHSSILNGFGSTGSRLLTGNTFYAQHLESKIARFHGYATGVLFNCGYMANVGLFSAVARTQDVIFFDSQIHASARAGIRLSAAEAFPFRHNDLEHLEKRLRSKSHGQKFITVESIYSTDGSRAPLREICQLADQYGAHVIVDEAHGVGIWGKEGRGVVVEEGVASQVFAQIVTFGKALGSFGAIILGDRILKDTLINFAPSYIYTTALPFWGLAAIHCSYDLFPTLERERSHLKKLISLFHSSSTQIQSIPVHESRAAKQASLHLLNCGYDVRPLTSPTVQQGKEVLRVCLHAFNTEEEIAGLLAILSNMEGL